uniref:S-adenosylmethionine-dependent methyltransferase domain-containing protein n=1 Tax=Odontella aurita TaxID=265563 RepID=A0A7S4K494_9STRA|mmetsp:Transcript_60513/g.179354  ORF Transcript_60513/g.179354 Transcript_60513/m.179354 type:complete len:124 (+) Transcript_60513:129-500(+)
MASASARGDEWDVVVLDPPKLAPSASSLDRASRKYRSLNRDAARLLHSTNGGILITCTCSGAMTQRDGGDYFLRTVREGATSAGRAVRLLRVAGAASCHALDVAAFPAGDYLTAATFHVGPAE